MLRVFFVGSVVGLLLTMHSAAFASDEALRLIPKISKEFEDDPSLIPVSVKHDGVFSPPKALFWRALKGTLPDFKKDLGNRINYYRDPSGAKLKEQINFALEFARKIQEWRQESPEKIGKMVQECKSLIKLLFRPCVGMPNLQGMSEASQSEVAAHLKQWTANPNHLQDIRKKQDISEEMYTNFQNAFAEIMLDSQSESGAIGTEKDEE